MEKKVLKNHIKGQKHLGKTNWAKVLKASDDPIIEDENPELTFKKVLRKPEKTNKS